MTVFQALLLCELTALLAVTLTANRGKRLNNIIGTLAAGALVWLVIAILAAYQAANVAQNWLPAQAITAFAVNGVVAYALFRWQMHSQKK